MKLSLKSFSANVFFRVDNTYCVPGLMPVDELKLVQWRVKFLLCLENAGGRGVWRDGSVVRMFIALPEDPSSQYSPIALAPGDLRPLSSPWRHLRTRGKQADIHK